MNRTFAGLVVFLFAVSGAGAAELRWPDTIYSHYSNQEPLRDVLESMASSQAIPVVVSDKVQDVISVSFTELSPGEIFSRLMSAYKLTWYYDGNTLYVYRIDETQSAVIKLRSLTPLQFQTSLERLDMFDNRFRWNADQDQKLIYFSGPPRFVSLVNEMAKQLDTARARNPNTVYTWVDRQGITHYSSAPPQLSVATDVHTIQVQPSAITPQADLQPAAEKPLATATR